MVFSCRFLELRKFTNWMTLLNLFYLDFADIPLDFECHTLTGGKYAVFILRGLHSESLKTMQSIFTDWLPSSEFNFDYREQFEIMGEKYISANDPNSEEELWIPIR